MINILRVDSVKVELRYAVFREMQQHGNAKRGPYSEDAVTRSTRKICEPSVQPRGPKANFSDKSWNLVSRIKEGSFQNPFWGAPGVGSKYVFF